VVCCCYKSCFFLRRHGPYALCDTGPLVLEHPSSFLGLCQLVFGIPPTTALLVLALLVSVLVASPR
jgi:hypothetical protein